MKHMSDTYSEYLMYLIKERMYAVFCRGNETENYDVFYRLFKAVM